MSRSSAIPRHLRSPGDDGYRTPTIEDTEAHASTSQIRLPRSEKDNKSPNNPANTTQPTPALPLKQRVKHLTWAYFTLTMATGGIANVLHTVPFRFTGLEYIGLVFFLVNICFFFTLCICISLRFWFWPYTFRASILHPTESLFVPASLVSFGTILINISQYGLGYTGPWLDNVVNILFWLDACLAVLCSAGIYLILWSTQTFTIAQMTPIWIFPAYPLLIIGPHAGILSATLDQDRALSILVGGMTVQGIGFLVSMMVYSAFIYRLMTQKLPKHGSRPGMFVSVGPSGFTVAGIVTMASNLDRAFAADFMGDGAFAARALRVVADWCALWLWGLAIWFFLIACTANLAAWGKEGMDFSMTWFSFVFPNTALITATFSVGKAFSCKPIQIAGCVMTVLLIGVWIAVVISMVNAVMTHQILAPQKGEDKDEGGWKMEAHQRERALDEAIKVRGHNQV